MQRRSFCALATALSLPAVSAWARPPTQLAAAWHTPSGAQVGVLQAGAHTLRVVAALDVPSRAHGLTQEPGGSLLAVARRPGEWLLRFGRRGERLLQIEAETDRAFNGHVLCSADGRTVYTTETDLSTAQGLIGVRDARTLAKHAEWPTHGIDPHALLWDEHAAPGTQLVVANGGIEIQPETGRMKLHLERMDSSLVRLSAETGALLGQWRVADRRLSLRHLAWRGHGAGAVLGVAMQAEHDDPQQRSSAPVLALFSGDSLRVVPAPEPLAGYGGDIAATPGGWLVSCPRAHGVARWQADGTWHSFTPLRNACALAPNPHGDPWVAGDTTAMSGSSALALRFRLDNHWVGLDRPALNASTP